MHEDWDKDTNLCDGQKCISNDLCQSGCCLGIIDDKKGVCYNISEKPCEQLANGESCINGNECISGHCLGGTCHDTSDWKLIYIIFSCLVAVILIIVAVVCVVRYRRKQRNSAAEFASSFYEKRATLQEENEAMINYER